MKESGYILYFLKDLGVITLFNELHKLLKYVFNIL